MRGLNLNKAGMEGLDAETIGKIIEENSKGSKFYRNEMRRGAILKQQVEEKLAIFRSLMPSDIDVGEKEADKILGGFLPERRFDRCIVHIDMDAFYAAVEMRDDPSLRLKPLAVGSQSMLSTSNYLARRFGVRAAMPGFLGKKLCPQLTIVAPDFVKYTEVSRAVRAVLGEYCGDGTALVAMSLDEVYLDVTQHLRERNSWPPERRTHWPRVTPKTPMLVCRCAKNKQDAGFTELLVPSSASNSPMKPSTSANDDSNSSKPVSSVISLVVGKDEDLATCLLCGMLIKSGARVFGTGAEEAVREMRFRVFCATRLTCSAGIAPNSLIAKIASDMNKPNGQYYVEFTPEAVEAFISPLPIRKVPGIGYVTECRLKAFGVEQVADMRRLRGSLFHLVSKTALTYYMRLTLGHSEDEWIEARKSTANGSKLSADACQKSMSVERTFQDCSDPEILQSKCRKLCYSVIQDMKEAHVQGKTVGLKLKLDTFEVRTRCQTLPDYTCSAGIVTQCALEILKEEMRTELATHSKPLTLRLMGVRVSNLVPSAMCQQFRQETLEAAFTKGFKGSNEAGANDDELPTASRKILNTSEKPQRLQQGKPPERSTESFTASTCPVCQKQLRLKNLEEMNDHLDTCLSRETVLSAVQETLTSLQPSTSKSRASAPKRPATPSSSTSAKGRGPLDKYFRVE